MSIFSSPPIAKRPHVSRRATGEAYQTAADRAEAKRLSQRRWNRNTFGADNVHRNADEGMGRETFPIDPMNQRGIAEGFAMLSDEYGE